MELKWILAIVLEAGFWIMLAGFLILRYRYGIEGITRLFVVGVVIDTLGILALGVWDFAATGEVSGYTLFIAALLIVTALGPDFESEKAALACTDAVAGMAGILAAGAAPARGPRHRPAVPGAHVT